jgi:MFS family permease
MRSRAFLTLAVAVFAASMGVGMVAPVLPVHAREIGASGTAAGLTFSAFAATQLVMSPFTGRLSDRYGRKPFILLGTATYIIAAIGWMLVDRVEAVIALRALTGLGSGLVFSLALAYIGDLAPEGQEGRFMGAFGIFDFLGFGVGPIVSGALRDAAGFDAVFLAMASLLSVSALTVALLLPRRARVSTEADASTPAPAAPWRTVLNDPPLQGLFAMRAGYAFAFGSAFSFLALYLEEEIRATATMVGFVLAGQELLGGLLQPAVGPLADRLDRRWLVMAGASMVAVRYITIGLSTSYVVILGAFVIAAGVGSALMGVATMALQVDVGRRLGMATTMSLSSAGFAFGVLAGSLIGGSIVDTLGTARVFVLAAIAVAVGAATFSLRTAGHTGEPGTLRAAEASILQD